MVQFIWTMHDESNKSCFFHSGLCFPPHLSHPSKEHLYPPPCPNPEVLFGSSFSFHIQSAGLLVLPQKQIPNPSHFQSLLSSSLFKSFHDLLRRLQAHLGDISGLVLDYCNKQVTLIFQFPSAYKNCVYTILQSRKCAIVLCLKNPMYIPSLKNTSLLKYANYLLTTQGCHKTSICKNCNICEGQ